MQPPSEASVAAAAPVVDAAVLPNSSNLSSSSVSAAPPTTAPSTPLSPSSSCAAPLTTADVRLPKPQPPPYPQPQRRRSCPSAPRTSTTAVTPPTAAAPPPSVLPLPIAPVAGLDTFYPQSLWVDHKQGYVDTDTLTPLTTYRLPAHKRLVAGKYVEDPELKDFSNPRYRGPGPGAARGLPRFSQMGDLFGSSRPPPLPPPGCTPQPVYATLMCPQRAPSLPAAGAMSTGTSAAMHPSTSGSFSTVGTSDYEYDDDEYEADEDMGGDEGGTHLPPIAPRRVAPARGGNAGRATAAVNGARASVQVVRQTYPVVEPIYPFSAASFYFPVFYGRPSDYERADTRGLPQHINAELHPNDRAHMPITSVSTQRNNLNRMGLFKIGPGAVAFKVVITAFEAAGMKYTTSNTKFNILWAKRATPYTLASLNPYQKVNHFPGTWGIGRKDSLAQNMTKMRRFYGDSVFDIVPSSFLIPRQEYELRVDAERNPDTPERPLIYILKPSASSCGRGIELCRGLPPMPRGGKQMVCQRYIGNPLLIFGRKFDLRLYCVVTSFDPLRIYLFDEGLVRFAAEKYPGPDKELENIHMHLTNYSVNKTADLNRESSGKAYDSDDPMDIKWCISDLKKHLAKHHPLGLEAWNRIQRECDDVVIKAMLSIENDVIERIRYECRDKTGRNCFELFGLDLMADDNLKVRLIEVNIMPSLATGSNLDKAVKARMLAHMLTLVRVIPYRRNALPEANRGRPRGTAPTSRQASRSRSTRRSREASPTWEGLRAVARSGSRTSLRRVEGGGARGVTEEEGELGEEETAVAPASAREADATEAEAPPRRGGGSVAEAFVPHGALMDRPERTYRFGRHPFASVRIVERPLLRSFNDPRDPDSTLSPYETLMLVEAQEELHCAGGFRRVFPDPATAERYLPLFTHGVRRNNYVLVSAVMMQAAGKVKED